MPPRAEPLNAFRVKSLGPGRYCDGNKLYLLIRGPERAWWLFRYTAGGKMREIGMGPARGPGAVSLATARYRGAEFARMVADGIDPLVQREAEAGAAKEAAVEAARKATTFRDEADAYMAAHAPGWENPKHRAQWASTMETYVYPLIGDKPVAAVTTDDVLGVLKPIWQNKAETAKRVRGRIEVVLSAAKVRGLRSGENPAQWRGHLSQLLPARSKVAPITHHAALPFKELPTFFLRLQASDGLSARALELAILTACRTTEVLGATWAEVDMDGGIWVIPAKRMKARREHRVPLSTASTVALRKLHTIRAGDYVFPGQREAKPLSNMALLMTLRRLNRTDITAHGFRSTFRDWAAETTDFSSEVVEMALAHAVGDKVEAAYRRGDLFEKRRSLMEDWAAFCLSATAVTP